MKLDIPELCLVVLIGTSGSGKSTFARKHFKPTEVISSDFCRGLISDDENDQASTKEAFDLLHYILKKRLDGGKLCVVDATNVQPEARKPLVEIAREYHVLPVAIVLDTPENICQERNEKRPDRDFGPHVIRRQREQMRRGLRGLEREGFRYVHTVKYEAMDDVQIERTRLWTNRKHETGPFDIIGDVHGCSDELNTLLTKLGYQADTGNGGTLKHPEGRRAIFLGDLCDRGPKTPEVYKTVMSMVKEGSALCVPGNHDMKLMRKMKGRDVRITHGLAESLEQLEKESEEFKKELVKFLDNLVSHYVLDAGKLVVAHAGMNQKLMGRASMRVRDFALYGETTGETDEYGLPVRYNWAQDYRGEAMVVYGHTPVAEPEWINRTICIDTGCVFGGKLTALRYPERELVSVPAAKTYYESVKPFLEEGTQAPADDEHAREDVLDIEDVSGKRHISTALHGKMIIREENAIAALEVMSRFALDPKWLIYLPPTMSPSETTQQPGLLEHPEEAFTYYRSRGVGQVVCEEKHMGSRAVVIVAKDLESAKKRFGKYQSEIGVCYTRTGRKFFNDDSMEREFLSQVCDAVRRAGFWDELQTSWIALDCELMPWSAKARRGCRFRARSMR
jgi:protein phosphatase